MPRLPNLPPNAELKRLFTGLKEGAISSQDVRQVVSLMPQPLFVKDAALRVVMMNPACEAMWGVCLEDIAGRDGAGIFPPEQLSLHHQYDRLAFAQGETVIEEVPLWHAGLQETRLMLTYKHPIYDADGQPYLLIGSSLDITERQRKETALADALQLAQQIAGERQDATESQHRRLATGMRDNLAQNLVALKLDIAMLHARTGAAQPLLHERAVQALATLDASIDAVRHIINELHPATLDLGLSAAIEWQLQQMARRQGLQCALRVLDDRAVLTQQTTSALFHIVQTGLEYLSTSAQRLQVELSLCSAQIAITLSSDRHPGASYPAEAAALHAMRQRLGALGGTLTVSVSAGTALHIVCRVDRS
ncbi:PAS domain-containing protein [Pseudoduganella sp. FT25W]|uniref:PAS domain-containing protein n=1 Tax=Duganella alba TaxID=2666081 RepID=A0A6L5QIR4_9BURK|nr:PAS domain-containing protein [Duganella alba]MRX08871.1 PAS domain-containing protein [Duganella alba]MRX18835.1 PAS domain-containing protein [Duganella alba]